MKNFELAIATDFGGESSKLEDIEQTLKDISEAGFTHVHWCHEWDGDYIYSIYEMEQIREWLDKYHLQVKALHASKGTRRNTQTNLSHYRRDYTSDWEYNRKAGVDLIKNRVDLANIIGATEIVLHLYIPTLDFIENPSLKSNFYDRVCRSLDELQPYCADKNVRICMENLFDVPKDIMVGYFDMLLGRYPENFLGICVDTGHAFMSFGDDMIDFIDRYKSRIYSVHIHDNNGSSDYHFTPEDGDINWKTTMKALSQTVYELPLTLELTSYENDRHEFLSKAYIAGKQLTKYYENEN